MIYSRGWRVRVLEGRPGSGDIRKLEAPGAGSAGKSFFRPPALNGCWDWQMEVCGSGDWAPQLMVYLMDIYSYWAGFPDHLRP